MTPSAARLAVLLLVPLAFAPRASGQLVLTEAQRVLPGAPQAVENWSFDETTSGADVNWTSPTSVDPASPGFTFDYAITAVDVGISFSGIPFGTFSVIEQVPPELLVGSACVNGPAPLTFFDLPVEVPPAPEPTSLAGNLSFGIDAAGQGFLTATDIVLGTVDVDLGIPFGVVTANITSLRIAGTLDADDVPWILLPGGVAGTGGVEPVFKGTGDLLGNDPFTLELTGARPNTTAAFVLGASELSAPFKGGLLVPSPDLIVFGIPTGPTGAIPLAATWPTGAPSGSSLWFQWWVTDPEAVAGLAASNGLQSVTP